MEGPSLSIDELLALPAPARRRAFVILAGSPSSGAAVSEIARPDPRDFIRDILGARPSPAAVKHGYKDPWTPQQEEVLVSLRDNRKTAVAAGVGVGKTRLAAWACLWFLFSRRPAKVITTAPTWLQVESLLWSEVSTAFASSVTPLPGKKLNTEIKITDEWFAKGLSTKTDVGDISATRFQGFHSPNLFAVLDEATGVADEVWEGAEGLALRPTDRLLVIGNPTDPSSRFKRTFDLGTWNCLHLDCRDHPNVVHNDPEIIPGAVTKDWIEEKLEEYGSEEAPLYKAKVAGQFPDQAADALISISWITRAQKGWTPPEKEPDDGRGIALGLDVAGEGEDLTVLEAIKNSRLFMPKVLGRYAWHVGRDPLQAVALVTLFINENVDEYGHTLVRSVAYDDTGLGQTVGPRLAELQAEGKIKKYAYKDDRSPREVDLIPVNFGSTPLEPDRFDLEKDDLWWEMREDLRAGKLFLPPEDEMKKWSLPRAQSLVAQLTVPFYVPSSSGKIIVFDKRGGRTGSVDQKTRERVKNLPSRSPDLAHAALLARRAWAGLRVDTAKSRPKNTEDAFVQQMIELAHKRHRNAKKPPKAYKGRNW
jgi:hypothetical protein